MKFFVIVVVLLLFVNSYLSADDGTLYTGSVEIKQEAVDAVTAKKKAMEAAFRFIFKDIVSREFKKSEELVDNISDQQISDSVYDYSVEREKYSDSFYMAKLSCRFKKSSIVAVLQSNGIVEEDNTDSSAKKAEKIKLAVYFDDFMHNISKMDNFECIVEKFSKKVVLFSIDSDFIDNFKRLDIRYSYADTPS